MEESGDVGFDFVARLGLFAAFEQAGDPGSGDCLGDKRDGGFWVSFPKGFDFGVEGSEFWILRAPVAEEGLLLFWSAIFGEEGFKDEGWEMIEGVWKGFREGETEAAEVEAGGIVGAGAAVVLDEGGAESQGLGVLEWFGEFEGEGLRGVGPAGAEVIGPGGFLILIDGVGGVTGDLVCRSVVGWVDGCGGFGK